MRWLFVGIVALNLLYFGWKYVSLDVDPAAGELQRVAAVGAPKVFPAALQLLAERAAGIAVAPAVAEQKLLSGCPAIGPFGGDKDATRAADALVGKGFKSSRVGVEREAVPLYWVYLPPATNRQGAMRKLRELQAKGIDSFAVTEGPDANAISLGSFASRDSATGVQARMRASGYDVLIREQARDIRQVWIVLQDPRAQGFAEFIPAEFRASVSIERQACARSR